MKNADNLASTFTKKIFELSPKLLGKERPLVQVSKSGQKIAVVPANSQTLYLFNKLAEQQSKTTIPSSFPPFSLQFDADDLYLSVATKDSVYIYSTSNFSNPSCTFDSETGGFCIQSWSLKSPLLALGTASGGLTYYNAKTNKKINMVGKHSKKVTYLEWNSNDLLLSLAEDKTINISKPSGDNEEAFSYLAKSGMKDLEKAFWTQVHPNSPLHQLLSSAKTELLSADKPNGDSKQKRASKASQQTTSDLFFVGLVTKGGRAISFIAPNSDGLFTEVDLKPNYGKAIESTMNAFGDLIVATNVGFIIKFTFKDGKLEESKADKFFQNFIEFIKFDEPKRQCFALGDNLVKCVDLDSLKEQKDYKVSLEKNVGSFCGFTYSAKGNLLVISTVAGYVFGILIHGEFMARLSGSFLGTKTSYNQLKIKRLSKEITGKSIEELEKQQGADFAFPGSEIADFCFVRDHVLVGQENQLSCYSVNGSQPSLIWTKGLDKSIEKIFGSERGRVLVVTAVSFGVLNSLKPGAEVMWASTHHKKSAIYRFSYEFTAVLENGTLFVYDNDNLELILSKHFQEGPSDLFMNEQTVEFYLYAPPSQKLLYYSIDGKQGSEKLSLPESASLKNVFFDETNPNISCLYFSTGRSYTMRKVSCHYKSPLSFQLLKDILNVEELTDSSNCLPSITYLDADILPLKLKHGFLTCMEKNSAITGTYLASHSFMLGALNPDHEAVDIESLSNIESKFNHQTLGAKDKVENPYVISEQTAIDSEKEYYLKSFIQSVELGLFEVALKAGSKLGNKRLWDVLSRTTLEHIDLATSSACYKKLSNFSMSYYISKLSERRLSFEDLRCEVAIILCDYDLAHKLFIDRGRYHKAVELLCHLHEFQSALEVAKEHNLENLISYITLELADQALKNEEFIKAQTLYEELLRKLAKQSAEATSKGQLTADKFASTLTTKPREVFHQANDTHSSSLLNADPSLLYKKSIFGLCALFIRQGSTLRTTQTLMQIQDDSQDEIEELAELAKECEQYGLSGELFSKIGLINKELEVCLKAVQGAANGPKSETDKLISKIKANAPRLTDADLILKLAVFVQGKDLQLAEKLFQMSGSIVEYVKFLLFVSKDIEKAEKIFESNKLNSQNAATYIADYYGQAAEASPSNQKKAIRYLLHSGRKIEAFRKAFESGNIDYYCSCVENFDVREAIILARHFSVRSKHSEAGKFYMLANEYEKALLSFIKSKAYDEAIELVYKLNDEDLFELMVQILAGETVLPESLIKDSDGYESDAYDDKNKLDLYLLDNGGEESARMFSKENSQPEPVNPVFLFKLYLKFGKVEQANTIALVIIDRELVEGSYKSAHQNAYIMHSQLTRAKAKIHPELRNKSIILQSYVIVKRALKFGMHNLAALLLDRICSFIHYMPKNSSEIMTSAVIESTKAGYKTIAYNWALTLCKPQYRSTINPKFKDKIEKIALKPVTVKEIEMEGNWSVGWVERTSSTANSGTVARCPACQSTVPDAFALACGYCLANFIICSASGRAIVVLGAQDQKLLRCKACLGVSYRDELLACHAKEGACPTCEEKRETADFELCKIEDVKSLMNA